MGHRIMCPAMGTFVVASPFLGAFFAWLVVPSEPLVAALWGGIGLLIGVALAAVACGTVALRREFVSRA